MTRLPSTHSTRLILIAVLFAVALVVGILPPFLHAQDAGPASHVGIVNLKLAFTNMQETIDFQHHLTDMQSQLTAMTDSHQAVLKQLQDKVTDSAKHGTSAQEELIGAMDQQSMDFQREEQTLKTRMLRSQNRQLKQAFDEIAAVVANLAKSNNLDLVLVDTHTDLPSFGGDNVKPETLANLVFNRSVLYTSDKIDITNEVIATLNKSYKSPANVEPPSTLPTIAMKIGSKTYQIEIAANDASREHGLMERDVMPPDHGMIFVFDQPAEQHFWMHHTRFPLDIIFVDAGKKIVSISTMKAYDEHNTDSNGLAKYAIELSAGAAAVSGVKPGDELLIPPAVDAALKK